MVKDFTSAILKRRQNPHCFSFLKLYFVELFILINKASPVLFSHAIVTRTPDPEIYLCYLCKLTVFFFKPGLTKRLEQLTLQTLQQSCIDLNISTLTQWNQILRGSRDGILERYFQSRLLCINLGLLRREFLSDFLSLFFRSTKCYS